ncbi:polysaccharide deacetylase family protein [Thermaerobacillus caldiproteolyticus]|uniref:Peptidoglycan/xylan/chitin deacetylase (PgdA/CDA1 family) n=1 Tax=Thermaerobacillus caldiproteolyticus TaxID=247480 RepID=A0A7V9Z611_9BACL|nr:polysaccharide deacetylase family protein [Anoxybacillus caldiproteolyticus]MBA2874590.1 peptidoglycan/xylan/chitin deacetylase (PgdA/CDA1 family) [Anoxybacillus caldiproteolyticus]
MKVKPYLTVAIAFCISVATLTASQFAFSASPKTIVATDDHAFFYRKVNGQLQPSGRLNQQQSFYATKVHPNWYVIRIGSNQYYIYKKHVKAVRASSSGINKSVKPIKTVYPQTNIWVYKKTDFNTPIGVIYKNTPLPIRQIEGPWYKVEFAGHLVYVNQKQVAGLATEVPIIVYHHILKEKENHKYKNQPTVVSYEEFVKQMRLLHDYGYHTITLHQLERFLKGKIDLPAKSMMIHFDDGLKTNYVYAYPILKKYGFHAAAFLITSRNSRPLKPFNPDDYQFLNWKEIEKMGDVFEFASHTHALHNRGKDGIGNLVKEPREVVKADLLLSRKLLHGTTYFTYPFGQYKKETIDILKETGFTMAFTTKIGTVKPGDDPYQLKRHGIDPHTTLQQFKQIIGVVE